MTCMHMTQTTIFLTDLGQARKEKTFFFKGDSIVAGHNAIKQQLAESRRKHSINILLVVTEEVACDMGLFSFSIQFLKDYSILSG